MSTDNARSAVYAAVDVGATVFLIMGLLFLVLIINEAAEAIDRWVDRQKEEK